MSTGWAKVPIIRSEGGALASLPLRLSRYDNLGVTLGLMQQPRVEAAGGLGSHQVLEAERLLRAVQKGAPSAFAIATKAMSLRGTTSRDRQWMGVMSLPSALAHSLRISPRSGESIHARRH